MKLDALKNISGENLFGDPDVDFVDVSCVAQDVRKGFCFVALKGVKYDGNNFIDLAIKNGASLIVADRKVDLPKGVGLILSDNPRKLMASISSILWQEPTKNFKLIGITGTKGKTTTAYLIESIFKSAGLSPAIIGTIEHRYDGISIKAKNTTPESCDLQRMFNDMKERSVDACAMEVSSHGLSLSRVEGSHFDGAVFTNLSQDHLDFHRDMQEYFEAKKILFTQILPKSSKKTFSVVNFDDGYGRELLRLIDGKKITYGFSKGSKVFCERLEYKDDRMRLFIRAFDERLKISTRLMGEHNASNVMAAISTGIGLEIGLDKIFTGIEKLEAVPGRLEMVLNDRGIMAFVDYAHTPDSLEHLLKTVRGLCPSGKIILVFGCGGNRDRSKRVHMGRIASTMSDCAIVTSDNPRDEQPSEIIDEIMVGIEESLVENPSFICDVIEERRAAIKRATEIATVKDVIVVAGKGHEDYQIIGQKVSEFDDRKVLKEFLG